MQFKYTCVSILDLVALREAGICNLEKSTYKVFKIRMEYIQLFLLREKYFQ